ncbi:MAG: HEAT repeat domain-containing protein [Gemmataceae bacterium]|nr:HEAT repeat domain-containing protein [Gemmataceae bacterium]MDW8267077.1 HEAT repeat domain-containing protein [Gemmataceae bacterium]
MRRTFMFVAALASALLFTPAGPGQLKDSEINGKTLNAWIKDLEDRDVSVRVTAIQTIVQYGDGAKRAIPILIGPLGLGSPDASVRVNAAIAVGVIGVDPRDMDKAVAALQAALKDPQGIVRYQAAMALGRLGTAARAALPYLCQYTIKDQTSWEIRKAAAFAIGNLAKNSPNGPEPVVLQALTSTFYGNSPDSAVQVRLEAIMALSEIGAPKGTREINQLKLCLENALYDKKDARVRLYARLLLMQLDPSYINDVNIVAIGKELTNPQLEARCHAARALGLLGVRAQSQIPNLIRMTRDKESAAAGTAITALVAMKDAITDSHIIEIASGLQAKEAHIRFYAVQALAALGPRAKAHVPQLIAMLADPDPAIVAASALALAEMPEAADTALPILKELTKHKDEMVRTSAEKAHTKIELTVKGVPMKLPAMK